MQIASPASMIPIKYPYETKPGMPTRGTVLLTAAPTANPHPAKGLGLGDWLLPQASKQDALDALDQLRHDYAQPLGVVRYHPHGMKGELAYGIAPHVQLTWHAGGYGGDFRERKVTTFGSSIHAVPGHR